MALDRENDDRAASKKQEALVLIRQDIQADMQGLSEVENPRIKSLNEARYDGVGATLDVPGFRPGD
jgi:predicted extracellular nuclease